MNQAGSFVLLVINYNGYNKDYPTETKKLTGSSSSKYSFLTKYKKINEYKKDDLILMQYSLIKPKSINVGSKRALGCSALYYCSNANNFYNFLLQEMKKKAKKTKPRWLLDYEVYHLRKIDITTINTEKYYILRLMGNFKLKNILNLINGIDTISLAQIHESRSIFHKGENRIIRTIIGFILFIRLDMAGLKHFTENLSDATIDTFIIENSYISSFL